MTTTAIAEPETGTPTTDADSECIACPCRPLITFCGAYDDSPLVDEWELADCCPECVEVFYRGCPGCGCRIGETCRKCEPTP